MIRDLYTETSPPAEEPVTLPEAKAWLRVRTTADDTLITSLISGVRLAGEGYCNRAFITRTLQGLYTGLQLSRFEPCAFLVVRRAPLISVSKVETYVSGAYADFTDYEVRQQHGFSRLLFANGIDADTDAIHPVRVTFTAGYGAAADVPEDIKTAIKQHISFLYENRGDVIAEGKLAMPLEAKLIYKTKYRILDTY